MRALITGGAGFVGSHLAERLLESGYDVTVIDDLSTGSMANIRHLKRDPRFHYFIDTVMNRGLLAELVDESEVIFHLAAAVGVRLIVESPVRTLHTNVRATELVLEAAAKKNKKVLITSTSEVYGKSTKIPFHEDDDSVIGPPVRGRWSYACSKAIDEFLAIAYYREKGVPVVITRLFNTVGPRQTGMYGMVVPRFVTQAIAGAPITIFGDGTQSRCFGYVGDVTNALVRLSELDSAVGLVFNVGSDQEVTINELAEVVKDVTGSDSPIRHISYEEAYGENFEDMMRRVPDLTRVREVIGYRTTKNLRQIVQAVADHLTTPKKYDLTTTEVDLVPGD
ncbi:MAG TPA: GDP-mannose 4,6-dehydratase [Terriglobales bacterium]|nr:GDP-mannose 4,6-dehydratase [Terriglobales bacterium]